MTNQCITVPLIDTHTIRFYVIAKKIRVKVYYTVLSYT